MRRRSALPLVVALASLAAGACVRAADDVVPGLEEWKKGRLERLKRPDGWLTVVGLSWLEPGDNAVGSAADAAVRLPEGRSPSRLGTIRLADGAATFVAAPGATVTSGGGPVTEIALRDDAHAEGPTILEHGSLAFFAIARNGRLAVRVKDAESAARRDFRGLDYYPADAKWRVSGRFEAAPPGSTFDVPNVLGYVEKIAHPGWVLFELGGEERRLAALDDTGDGRLFLVFGDRTNGRETYGGGRFLYTDPPADGKVTIDFNRAYNPPCVFTPFATCPLPPPGNRLPLAVEAGEKKFAGAVHP